MSWSEVKKINSDFAREPLNFNNYINDISIFGSRSYVLDTENSQLWRDLIVNSLTMYGHDAIHETIYERFTDDDVDYMIKNNGQLGQSFNSFYSVTSFAAGGIDTVLSSLTAESYDVLEPKFKSGIYRYISEKTADNTAGQWLGTIYNIDELKAKTDIASIVSDTGIWTGIIMNNASLRRVISISETTVQYFAANPSDVYVDFITEVCHNTDATMSLFRSLKIVNGITDFMNNEAVVQVLANNRESMVATTFMLEPFAAMIASEVAMNAVANSDVAIEVIMEAITNVTNSEKVISDIDANISVVEEKLPEIADTENMTTEVTELREHISEVTTKLATVSSQTHILIDNIHSIAQSETAMNAIALSTKAVSAIGENASIEQMNFLADSPAFVNAIYSHIDTAATIIGDYDMPSAKLLAKSINLSVSDYDTLASLINVEANRVNLVANIDVARRLVTSRATLRSFLRYTQAYNNIYFWNAFIKLNMPYTTYKKEFFLTITDSMRKTSGSSSNLSFQIWRTIATESHSSSSTKLFKEVFFTSLTSSNYNNFSTDSYFENYKELPNMFLIGGCGGYVSSGSTIETLETNIYVDGEFLTKQTTHNRNLVATTYGNTSSGSININSAGNSRYCTFLLPPIATFSREPSTSSTYNRVAIIGYQAL